MKKKARIIAFYLPQYHPIKENDEWWGKGFTEWNLVAQARPMFKGHIQPKIPGELGFYDLRLEETRIRQAELAESHGIEGFCYWHYWLGNGKRLLELPFNKVLSSKKPNFPFCLGWANHDWKGVFFGAKNKILIKQNYFGLDDYEKHFYTMLNAFTDSRYLKVKDKLIFHILRPKDIPNCKEFTNLWRTLALKEGLNGFHFIGSGIKVERKDKYGLDAVTYSRHREPEYFNSKNKLIRGILQRVSEIRMNKIYEYENVYKNFVKDGDLRPNEYPSIIPGWDTTARLGKNALVIHNNTPDFFEKHIAHVLAKSKNIKFDENIIFLKSWNEWSEGNYVEPDSLHGTKYLEAIKNQIYIK